jgi:predicted GTPase
VVTTKVGKSSTIPARWTGDGYEVDDLDVWKHNH